MEREAAETVSDSGRSDMVFEPEGNTRATKESSRNPGLPRKACYFANAAVSIKHDAAHQAIKEI
jgi:hypothetical protein